MLGSGAVHGVDTEDATQSNLAKARANCALSLHGVRLHVLASSDGFDFDRRTPLSPTTPGSGPPSRGRPMTAAPEGPRGSIGSIESGLEGGRPYSLVGWPT